MLAALRICGLCALAAVLIVGSPRNNFAADKLQHNSDIRPILSENCFACHGPDSAARKADLRLDKREVAVEMGALAPGKPNESTLVERVFAMGVDEMMPPPATKKTLTASQKDLLKQWIA